MKNDGTTAALGAAVVLAAIGLAAKARRGSKTVNAYLGIGEEFAGRSQDSLEFYYPQTAEGTHQPGRGERVFWTGSGYRRCGYVGREDGSMVPIRARYVEAMPGNLFDAGKLSALVDAIEDGGEPIVDPGYADLALVDATDVRQSRQSPQELMNQSFAEPYERSDIGALTAQVRDGNHRSFAPLIAGARFTWVRISDRTRQEIMEPRASMKSYYDRLYREIRKAQKAHGAPLLRRPRKARTKHVDGLAQAEQRYAWLESEIERLERVLLQRYDDGSDWTSWSPQQRLRRAGLFWRQLLSMIRKRDRDEFERIVFEDQDYGRKAELDRERMALWSKLYDMRRKAGLDPRTGERRMVGGS